MKKQNLLRTLFLLTGLSVFAATAVAQKPKPVAKLPKPIIFAVLNDGTTLEPIAYVNKGKLEAPVSGGDDANIVTAFTKTYYKPGAVYRLIFGTADGGSVTVKSSNPKSDCAKNMATVITKAAKTPLKGLVMGLATNAPGKSAITSSRRRPTPEEKIEIDALARAQFVKQKLTPKILRSHNLTALDLDNDGTSEFVGSYWVEIDKLTRGLLFLIAVKGTNGKYSAAYHDYYLIDQANVMSGAIKDVDEGVLNELLLDAFDYDGDGTSEVFTYTQSFEGAGFNAYRRNGAEWTKAFEGSNYHCGY